MEVLYANVLIFFLRYLSFLKSFFKKELLIRYLLDYLKYLIYVLAFLLVGAISGYLLNIYGMIFVLLKYFKLDKKILIKVLITVLMFITIYFFGLYKDIVDIMPFMTLFIALWLKPYIKNNLLYFILIVTESYLWIRYAIKFDLYVIVLYEAIDLGFNIGLRIIKKINNFVNKRI